MGFVREREGNGRRRGFMTTRSAVLPLDESRLRRGPGVEPGWADGNGVVTAFAASFVRVTGGSRYRRSITLMRHWRAGWPGFRSNEVPHPHNPKQISELVVAGARRNRRAISSTTGATRAERCEELGVRNEAERNPASLPCIPFHHGDVLEGSLDWVPRLERSNRIKKRQQELRGHVPESTAPKADVVLEASAFVGDLGIEPSWKNTCSTGTPRSIRVYSPKSPWGDTSLHGSASYGSRTRLIP